MRAQFSDDDVGKRVVNENGEEIGIVSAIEHGTAHVEPDPGITDTIKAKLGWQDRDTDAYPLQEAMVERITDDEVRLGSDLGGAGETTTGVTDTRTGDVGTTGTRDTGVGDDSGITDDEGLLGDDEDDDLVGGGGTR